MVDRLKREFYARLDALRRRDSAGYYSGEVHALVMDIIPEAPSTEEARNLHAYAEAFVERNFEKLDRLIEQLAAEIKLDASTRDLDELLASLDPAQWHPEARREVLVNYLGFPFWDVLTFPMTSAHEVGELNEILVDRISPQDARTLRGFEGIDSLKGIGFAHFAAFLSRSYRENDYLLGRLHAIDRLIDIVCDCAGRNAWAGRRAGAEEAGIRSRARCRGEAPRCQQGFARFAPPLCGGYRQGNAVLTAIGESACRGFINSVAAASGGARFRARRP